MALSLEAGGQLKFEELGYATEYWVEWSSALDGNWNSYGVDQPALSYIPVGGNATQAVNVPLLGQGGFFRVRANLEPLKDAFSKLEGENYDNMSGVQFEPGNVAIGWYDDGDWIMYENVDFGDKRVKSIVVSIAKANTGGAIEVRLGKPDGTLLGVITPQSTGSWMSYSEQQTNVTAVDGVHDLYLVAKDATGVANIDWLQFSENAVYEPNYVLFWQDEFEGTALDTAKWHPVQHGDVDNGELQFYTDRPANISVSDGNLNLTAIRETYTGTGPWMSNSKTSQYTSGKVQGQGKVSFQYGKIEARLKMPRGEGLWPAFWMLGDNIFEAGVGWPLCGEIDIMEHANVLDNIGSAIHTGAYNHTIGTQKTGAYSINDYDTAFHIYGVEWTSDKLAFYVDGNVFFTVHKSELGDTQAEWPFDQPFWLILNLAVGGAWGGDPASGQYPYTMQVDWVRVYKDQPL